MVAGPTIGVQNVAKMVPPDRGRGLGRCGDGGHGQSRWGAVACQQATSCASRRTTPGPRRGARCASMNANTSAVATNSGDLATTEKDTFKSKAVDQPGAVGGVGQRSRDALR
jgi:hypothetical protein